MEIKDGGKSFYDYILEDKSKYRKACDVINPRTGQNYIDPDGDFLVGESGGFLFNIDFSFINTAAFSEVSKNYVETGKYSTYTYGSTSYERFRVREEYRRKNGLILPAKYVNGEIKDIRITGEHYNFLNYGRIRRLDKSTIVKGSLSAKKKDGFPRFFDAQYWYYKAKEFARRNGFHMIVAKSRRGGFSYMEGVGSANNVNLNPGIIVIHGAYLKDYLIKGKALSVMAKRQLDFYEKHTPFIRGSVNAKDFSSRGLLKSDIEELRVGFKYKDGSEGGYLSSIPVKTFKDNPDAAIGADADEIKLEELSNFPNIMKSLDVTEPTTRTGAFTTGFIVGFGTGGSREGNWIQFEYLFYNPMSYFFMPFENVWDEAARHTVCGFYKPYWWGLEGFNRDGIFAVDDHGNSNYKVAMEISNDERTQKKAEKKTTDEDYRIYCGQYSNCPSESFSAAATNLFTSPELDAQVYKVKHDPDYSYFRDGQVVVSSDGAVDFKTNSILESQGTKIYPYIENTPIKQGDIIGGCLREFYPPFKKNGKVPDDLYVISYDPVAVDKENKELTIKHSLNAFHVWMLPNNISNSSGYLLVASFAGRRNTREEVDRILLNTSKYYNAKVLPEVNVGEVISNFKKWGEISRIMRDPTGIIYKSEIKMNAPRGVTIANGPRADDALVYLKDLLYTPLSVDDNGRTVYVLHYIKDLPTLLELQKFNSDGNFDRVSSLRIIALIMKARAVKNKKETSFHSSNIFEEIGLYNYTSKR